MASHKPNASELQRQIQEEIDRAIKAKKALEGDPHRWYLRSLRGRGDRGRGRGRGFRRGGRDDNRNRDLEDDRERYIAGEDGDDQMNLVGSESVGRRVAAYSSQQNSNSDNYE
mmetsp:Transcript_59393/g.88197  ORF Transcript_59393/g.88197 Transcript_59393/m.88197 type:complete len:113 (-) Transcript_59393:204-542(-)